MVFYNHLFVLKTFDGFVQPHKMDFDHASLWFQLHNLPLKCMNRQMGERLVNSMGVVEEVDGDGVGWGNSLWVKIKMDLMKPIARGCTVHVNGGSFWVPVCYEKLPRVCFECCHIFHFGLPCSNDMKQRGGSEQFGTWLRADVSVRRRYEKVDQMGGTGYGRDGKVSSQSQEVEDEAIPDGWRSADQSAGAIFGSAVNSPNGSSLNKDVDGVIDKEEFMGSLVMKDLQRSE